MRQSQTELNLVGGHISVSTALDGAEGVESRAGGASDTEGVHYGGAVGGRGVWGAVAMGVSSCCRRKELPMIEGRMRDASELARRLSASGCFGDAITCASHDERKVLMDWVVCH